MTTEDVVRQIDKGLDVLEKVETMMVAEATMNATKHMSESVRPVPLASAVSALIDDYRHWRARLVEDQGD